MSARDSVAAAAVPVTAAIGAFGVIYGASAAGVLGDGMAVASSVLLFSGAAQFTMVGLADGGAAATSIVLAVAVLGVRHLPLAAVVRPRLPVSRGRRAALALVLIDETTGLAVASGRPAARTMAVVGGSAYAAWIVGTVAGVAGADLVAAAPLAEIVFVVLFTGLAALTCRPGMRGDAARAVVAGALTTAVLLVVPWAGAAGAIAVAVGVAFTSTSGVQPADGSVRSLHTRADRA